MLLIPFEVEPGAYSLFVVLGDDNWSRITDYDPAQVPIAQLGRPWVNLRLRDVVIGYANATDQLEVERLIAKRQPMAALRHLSRGFAFRPDRGDHDNGPQRMS